MRSSRALSTAQQASSASATPLPPDASSRSPSPPIAPSMPSAASMPSAPAGDHQDHGRSRAEPALDGEPEDHDPDGRYEQVADVGVDPWSCEVAPPLAAGDLADDRSEVLDRDRARALDDHQHGRDHDRREHPVRAALEALRDPNPAPAGTSLGSLAAAAGPTGLARLQLVAASLELRRSLADPGAAIGALGHVGADLGPAAAADDAQLRRAHAPRIPRPLRGWKPSG